MTSLRYSPLHVTELCGEMQGKFIVGCARLIKEVLYIRKDGTSNQGCRFIILEHQCKWLFTKLVRSSWLDIGQVLFLRVYGRRRSRGPETRQKEQAWSIKDLLYGFRGNFSSGKQRVIPRGQDIALSCPLG